MTRLFATLTIALCLGACATAGGPAVDPAPSSAAATAESAGTATTADVATGSQAQEATHDDIEMIEVKGVEPVAAVQAEASTKDERICRREVRTGTHRAVRVCRTRAEIDRMEQEGKDTFRDLYESQRVSDQAEQRRRQ